MPAQPDLSKLTVRQFAERFRGDMIPLSSSISYFCAAAPPLSEEDLKEYLQEPVAALPPTVAAALPKISILLVPYLEREPGKTRGPGEYVSTEKPPESRFAVAGHAQLGQETVLALALKDQEVAEYHYRLYQMLATVLGEHWNEDTQARYTRLLRDELTADAHGEVDEGSWRMKQALRRGKSGKLSAAAAKAFQEYAQQSFMDTLTLYLHGICCDIDMEPGPRQLPSRYLRKRLNLLQELFPPPEGYAVFPEQLKD